MAWTKRAVPTERTVARIFREAGASVWVNAFLRDMTVNVSAEDSRRIEVLAQDLPCFGGVRLAVCGCHSSKRADRRRRGPTRCS